MCHSEGLTKEARVGRNECAEDVACIYIDDTSLMSSMVYEYQQVQGASDADTDSCDDEGVHDDCDSDHLEDGRGNLADMSIEDLHM